MGNRVMLKQNRPVSGSGPRQPALLGGQGRQGIEIERHDPRIRTWLAVGTRSDGKATILPGSGPAPPASRGCGPGREPDRYSGAEIGPSPSSRRTLPAREQRFEVVRYVGRPVLLVVAPGRSTSTRWNTYSAAGKAAAEVLPTLPARCCHRRGRNAGGCSRPRSIPRGPDTAGRSISSAASVSRP